jgi:hypothetical protein
MGLMDVLGRYGQTQERIPTPQVMADFDSVASEAPPEILGEGLEDAFNSDVTPPFEQMVGQLYDRSDPQVRAGLLNEILGSAGGAASAGLAAGPLGAILRRMGQGQATADDTRDVGVHEVEVAAREAAKHNPGIIARISRFYARHPQLVQNLGQAAIAIAMNGMARRRRI